MTISAESIPASYIELLNLKFHDLKTNRTIDWAKRSTVPEKERLQANFGAFNLLSHFHLYFANLDGMDNRLLLFLMNLPSLTHLRLSGPTSSSSLYPGVPNKSSLETAVERLLSDRPGCQKMESIIVQVGSTFDSVVSRKLIKMEQSKKWEQLYFLYPGKCIADRNTSSTLVPRKDINLKVCEDVAFQQFAFRAGGGQGIWSKDCIALWG